MTNHTVESLVAFSDRVKAAYLDKQIRSPVHFCSDTQAQPLIGIFKEVRPHDWLFCGWRNMFHCLLKGMPEDDLFQQILEGRSMFIASKEHRIICSSIVGGILPMALGVAMGIRQWRIDRLQSSGKTFPWGEVNPPYEDTDPKVFCFIGDMTKRIGLFHEFIQYVTGFGLNVRVICENNERSTNAFTKHTWGKDECSSYPIRQYNYLRTLPHVGLEQRVNF